MQTQSIDQSMTLSIALGLRDIQTGIVEVQKLLLRMSREFAEINIATADESNTGIVAVREWISQISTYIKVWNEVHSDTELHRKAAEVSIWLAPRVMSNVRFIDEDRWSWSTEWQNGCAAWTSLWRACHRFMSLSDGKSEVVYEALRRHATPG